MVVDNFSIFFRQELPDVEFFISFSYLVLIALVWQLCRFFVFDRLGFLLFLFSFSFFLLRSFFFWEPFLVNVIFVSPI